MRNAAAAVCCARMNLDQVEIVLVAPSHGGNVGGAARAMKNMGLARLSLVTPAPYDTAEAVARAVGAEDVLRAATVHDSLDAAVQNAALVIGTSARRRRIAWPVLTPREAASRLLAESAGHRVALVFGRERTGLTNDELDRCHALVTIPTNPEFSSLNLAAAVQIMVYEIFQAASAFEHADLTVEADHVPASQAEVHGFLTHLETVLVQTEFMDPNNPRKLMRRLTRLFNRARPDQNEVNILRGILTSIERALRIGRNT